MANHHRGEIEADIGGTRRRLVLTLGALAELEDAFGAEDLVALTERFGSGRLKARDLTRIIGAGLRGAGAAVTDDDVAVMAVEGSGSRARDAFSLETGDRHRPGRAPPFAAAVLVDDAARTGLCHRSR